MKKLLASCAVLFGLSALVACSNETDAEKGQEEKKDLVVSIDEPVTIEFWHAMSGPYGEVVNQLVQDFNSTVGSEKGITVEGVYQGAYNDLKSKVTASIKAQTVPAISQAYPDWVAEYLQSGSVVALDDYINHEEVGIKDFEDISEAYREENSQYEGGKFYSLPFNKSTEVLYYNKTFFEENNLEVPTTWEEMENVSKQITEITGKPAFGFDSAENAFLTLVRQFGGEYTNTNGEVLFGESDAAVNMLEMIKRNTDAGYWRLAGEDKYMSGPFTSGLVQMYIGSTSGASHIVNGIAESDKPFEWSATPIPQQSEETKAVIQQGTNVVIMQQENISDQEVYAAYEFAKFLGSYEANLYWTMNTGYLPIRQSVVDSEEYQNYISESGDMTKLAGPAQADYYFYDLVFTNDDFTSYNVRTAAGVAVENVVLNGMEPAQAVEEALRSLNLK